MILDLNFRTVHLTGILDIFPLSMLILKETLSLKMSGIENIWNGFLLKKIGRLYSR